MKKLLILFALIGQFAFAQKIEVTSTQLLLGTEKGGYYHPTFSPKGSYLLTTTENYAGLKQHSLTTQEVKTVTSDAGAGYDVSISADENNILYKKTEMKNQLRYTSLQQYNVQENTRTQVVAATREKLTPAFAKDKVAYVKGNSLLRSESAVAADILPFINIEDQKMVLYAGAKKTVLTPNGADASYFWASVSPDQKHIVYTVAKGGTFICNIDGSKVVSLGKLNAPKWLNNQWVVGMHDLDDGNVITSSSIVVKTIDGKVSQTLKTPQTPIAMYPAASADGKRIAFNTNEGEIYIINIQIK
jgi:Tol biopolymer transport system component